MIVWPVTSSRRRTAKRSAARTGDGQSHATLSGVRTMRIVQHHDLEPEAAESGTALGLEILALVLDRPRRPRRAWRGRIGVWIG